MLFWEQYDKPSPNPVTGGQSIVTRRRIKRDMELPMGEESGTFVSQFVVASQMSG